MLTAGQVSEKWVLVIDDVEGTRAQLRMSLSNLGFAKLHVVSSIKEALERLTIRQYDVILCDYLLGDGTDGQQFLEYLRTNDFISRNTIFIIITGEQSYERVMAASECAPDDYLLKPFTAAQFNARLEKLLEKQAYFLEIDRASNKKNWEQVIAECDRLLPAKNEGSADLFGERDEAQGARRAESKTYHEDRQAFEHRATQRFARAANKSAFPKHYFELCKIKGAALLRNNQAQEATSLYQEVLALRPLPWAKLNLARALAMLDDKAGAEKLAREVLAESPQFMAAYDFLGSLLAGMSDKNAAMEILQKAREISPGTMSRTRELSNLALATGQPEIAEKVMSETLQKNKYSPVLQANDYAVLSKALVRQGMTHDALRVVKDARKSFADNQSNIVLSATESLAHHAAGNESLAQEALARAMEYGDIGNLPADTVVTMADACFALGKEEDATRLLHHAVQNNQDNEAIKDKVHDALLAAGKDRAEASALIEASEQEVILLNNDGVRKAEAGQLGEAIELLCEAANRLPKNLQIVGNAALVIALDLVRNGKDPGKLAKCLGYRKSLFRQAPAHPKLEQIDNMLKQLEA